MNIEQCPIDSITPYADNPRIISDAAVDKVMASIIAYGFQQPIVVDAQRVIIVGHTRHRAARKAGMTTVPVVCADQLTADQVRAYRVADNRTAEESEWDQLRLRHEVEAISLAGLDVSATAFDSDQLARLLAGDDLYDDGVGPREDEATSGDPDAVPALVRTTEPASVLGQVYQLGPHLLMCGSSTDAGQVEQLFGTERIDCVWTDPPYGVAYVGKTAAAMTIQNDDLDEAALDKFLRAAFTQALERCKPGATWYVASPGGPLFHIFGAVLRDYGIWRQTILWVKDAFVLGRQDHHWKHEPLFVGAAPTRAGEGKDSDPILYGWKEGKHYWRGGRCQDTVWEIPRPKRNADHPTMKPVALVHRALLNSTRRGSVVYDPFGGSGTTLIAAAKAGCHARLMELSPVYCDVIRRRWATFAVENHLERGSGCLDP